MHEHSEVNRSKTLLVTIVRRHLRRGDANGPIGRLIAEERSNLTHSGEGATASDSLESRLADRLYRRFLLQRDPTVGFAFAPETRLA